ncbi:MULTISPECIES: tyrosine-protein phosphatase [unclassified Leucobacter]|uniref:tyrosine-protein phosphatase n=1 Tax=unclassified Leucobacter TaxID=2621730 RepID=UPI00165E783A|nr:MULTISPECIES: tyrosine-protein phosphatase [unclassified Leucobacter]MBC9926544.1 tyrosine-protein phosphatase [Leucobacter sp. cx-169]MBC9937145.1 tyrosine-protein phosphatase [Leucobacter sp. cx-87]
MTTRERLIPIDGTANFRDLGGYRADGGWTNWGALFRSDGLHRVSEAGQSALVDLGVKRVIDLRDAAELEMSPDAEILGAEAIHHPIFASAREHVAAELGIMELTEVIYLSHGDTLTAAVRLLADDVSGATLFHCTAGKDRTGAVAALTLTAVGVDRDDVLADYEVTAANLAGPWLDAHLELLRSFGVTLTPKILELVGDSPAPALERALDQVESRFGSVRDYLFEHGLTEAELARLHARLVSAE